MLKAKLNPYNGPQGVDGLLQSEWSVVSKTGWWGIVCCDTMIGLPWQGLHGTSFPYGNENMISLLTMTSLDIHCSMMMKIVPNGMPRLYQRRAQDLDDALSTVLSSCANGSLCELSWPLKTKLYGPFMDLLRIGSISFFQLLFGLCSLVGWERLAVVQESNWNTISLHCSSIGGGGKVHSSI